MNTTDFSANYAAPNDRKDLPVAVQVLGIIAFGVFSIVATALAFTAFWVAGLIITAIIATTWSSLFSFGKRRHNGQFDKNAWKDIVPSVSEVRSSGNASFDAYRNDTLARLEQESREFDTFLVRLREARDSKEFDQFMSERAGTSPRVNDNAYAF